MMNHTTRTYPRTMREAFPGHVDYSIDDGAFKWTPVRIAQCIVYALAVITLACVIASEQKETQADYTSCNTPADQPFKRHARDCTK